MRTYSRRNKQPAGRSGASDGASLSTPSTPLDTLVANDDHRKGNSSSSRSSCRSSSSSRRKRSAVLAPAESATAADGHDSIEQPAPTPPRPPSSEVAAAAVSLERKRRHLALATVPVCPLSSISAPSLSTPSASVGAFGVERRPGTYGSGGAGTGGGGGGRFGDSRSDGSSSVFGVRTLWGAGDPLSSSRKRRRPGVAKSGPAAPSTRRQQQQQLQGEGGSALKKRAAGKGGETGRTVSPASGKKEQMVLDFGQKSLGQRILCPRCNVLYVCGSADDKAQHASVCAQASRGVDFAGWKQERVRARFSDDGARVVEIREGDPAAHLAKLREVERLMDVDMGFAPGGREETVLQQNGRDSGREGKAGSEKGSRRAGILVEGAVEEGVGIRSATKKKAAVTAFLYVRGKRVLGCVIAERIESARRAVLEGGSAGSAQGSVGKKPAAPLRTPSKKAPRAALTPNLSKLGLASPNLVHGASRSGGTEVPGPVYCGVASDTKRCSAGKAAAAAAAAVVAAAEDSAADVRHQHAGNPSAPVTHAPGHDPEISRRSGDDVAPGIARDGVDDVRGALATGATESEAADPASSSISSAGPPLSPSRAVNETAAPPRKKGGHESVGDIAGTLGSAADELLRSPGSVSGVGVAGTSSVQAEPAAVKETMRPKVVGRLGGDRDGGGGGPADAAVAAAAAASLSSARASSHCYPSSRRGPRRRKPSKKRGGDATSATPCLESFWIPQRGHQPSGARGTAAGAEASALGAPATGTKTFADGSGTGSAERDKSGDGMAAGSETEEGQGRRDESAVVAVGDNGGDAGDRPGDGGGCLRGLRAWTAGKGGAGASSPPKPTAAAVAAVAAAAAAAGERAVRTGSPCPAEGRGDDAARSEEKVAIPAVTQHHLGGEGSGENSGSSHPDSRPRGEETGGEEKREGREARATASFLVSEDGARAPTAAAAGTKQMRVRASPWSLVPTAAPVAATAQQPGGSRSALAPPSVNLKAMLPLAVTGKTGAPTPTLAGTVSPASGGGSSGGASGGGLQTRLENPLEPDSPSGSGAHHGGCEAGRLVSKEAREGAKAASRSTRRPVDGDGGGSGGTKNSGATAVGAADSTRSGSENVGDGGGVGGVRGDVGVRAVDGDGDGGGEIVLVGGCHHPGGGEGGPGGDGDVVDGVGGAGTSDVPDVGADVRPSGADPSEHPNAEENTVSAAQVTKNGPARSSLPLSSEHGGRLQQQQQQQQEEEEVDMRRSASPTWSMDSTSLADSEDVPSPDKEKEGGRERLSTPLPTTVLTCEDKHTPAVAGVLQVWVHEQSRRQGVATRLVDTVREKLVYGLPLRREQMAFSQPTREGQAFAIRYTGGEGKLLVY